MNFGNCPKCKSSATRKWFKVSCENCQAVLKQTRTTTVFQYLLPAISFVIASFMAMFETKKIIQLDRENVSQLLLHYYFDIYLVTAIVSGIIVFIIRQLFSVYEEQTSST